MKAPIEVVRALTATSLSMREFQDKRRAASQYSQRMKYVNRRLPRVRKAILKAARRGEWFVKVYTVQWFWWPPGVDRYIVDVLRAEGYRAECGWYPGGDSGSYAILVNWEDK